MEEEKLSRRAAIRTVAGAMAATVLVHNGQTEELAAAQVKVFKVYPLTGNNPIVIGPPNLTIATATNLTVEVTETGTVGAIYVLRLERLAKNGTLTKTAPPGFYTGATEADIKQLDPSQKAICTFAIDKTAAFDPYSLLANLYVGSDLVRTFSVQVRR